MGLMGDSAWVYDGLARELIVRNRRGVWSRQLVPTLVAGYTQTVIGVLADGTLAFESDAPERAGMPDLGLVWVQSKAGPRLIDSLAGTPSMLALQTAAGDTMRTRQPWRTRDLAILTHDGRGVLVIRAPPASRDSGEVEIIRYEAPTYQPTERRLAIHPFNITHADVEIWKRRFLRDELLTSLGGKSRANRELEAHLLRPVYFPLISAAVELDHKRLLVQRQTSTTTRTWEVYDSTGQVVGTLTPGDSWRLLDAADGRLLWTAFGKDEKSDTIYTAHIQWAPRAF